MTSMSYSYQAHSPRMSLGDEFSHIVSTWPGIKAEFTALLLASCCSAKLLHFTYRMHKFSYEKATTDVLICQQSYVDYYCPAAVNVMMNFSPPTHIISHTSKVQFHVECQNATLLSISRILPSTLRT